nr:MAG TPA: hypothetical protein [Caudoviricetes sp.]
MNTQMGINIDYTGLRYLEHSLIDTDINCV